MIDAKTLPNARLRELIVAAIDSTGRKDKEIAEECGVSPQAVYSWKEPGRIAKGTLKKLAAATNKPLGYFLDEVSADESLGVQKTPKATVRTIEIAKSVNIEMLNDVIAYFLRSDKDGRENIHSFSRDVALSSSQVTTATSGKQS